MRLYQTETEFNCGIDLHSKQMYACVMDRSGDIKEWFNVRGNDFEYFLRRVAPYRHDMTLCCECTFNWYWLADACEDPGIEFVLAHALYLRSIHMDKNKNDREDARKIADLLRTNLIPYSYVYPRAMRPLRTMLRTRMNYEVGEIDRFPRHQEFCSYARLVKGTVASAGKIQGARGSKMGNGYLKWAMKEAVQIAKRSHPDIKAMAQRLERKHSPQEASAIIAHRLGRCIYYMLKHGMTFSMELFEQRMKRAS